MGCSPELHPGYVTLIHPINTILFLYILPNMVTSQCARIAGAVQGITYDAPLPFAWFQVLYGIRE